MNHGTQIAKNAAWLMAATTGQKIIAFLVFTLIARWVGVEITGRYFFAVSVTSVFVILTDLGMTPVVIRELAADAERGLCALKRALIAKAFLIPLTVALTMTYALLTQGSTQDWVAIGLACFVMSADAVSLIWYGAIRGKRQLRYEALGMFVGQFLTAIVSLTAAGLLHAGVNGLIVALMAGSFWNVGWSIWRAKKLGVHVAGLTPWPWKDLFIAALPFALAGIFVKVYSYVDTLLLKQFHDATAVGYYAIAYKVTYAFQFMPLAFVAALYPGLSAVHASGDREGLKRVVQGSLRLMIVIAAPLSAALSAFSVRVIPLVYGEAYRGSVVVLGVLAWVLIPIFLDFPIGSLLNATHRAGKKTMAMGITMVVNVVANILLVPTHGPIGAAWAGFLSFWVLFFVGVWFVRHDLDLAWFARLFGKGLLTAVFVWLAILYPFASLSLPVAILLAMALALGLLIGLGLVGKEDMAFVRSWVGKGKK
ncbi:MAG: flippase [Patescibacteria group bacterium]